jgi:transglutaminase-like putative cysteine protease
MLLFVFLFLALAAAPAPLRCQTPAQNPPATRGNSQDPDGIIIEKFDTTVRFESNGTGERTRTAVVRVESDAAVRQLGVLAFSFNSSGERLTVDYVRVRKRDGSTVQTPSSNFQETLSPVTQAAPMYSNIRAMQVPVRSLAAGDTLEYRIAWIQTKPDIPDQFWYAYDFIHDGTVKAETLTIDVPAGKYVKIAGAAAEPKVTEQNSRKIYYWSSSHVGLEKAPGAASYKRMAHAVEITTLKSWEDLGRWYAEFAAPKAAVTPAIQTKVSELTKGLVTTADKEQAIYDYVSTRFRYVSISLGDARYQPHTAEDVLSNLYGDCKDKDTLLRALLKAAGIDAWPALIGEDLPFDADSPSLAQFNHVITVIPNADGKYLWLDSTPEIAPFGFLQKSLRGKQTLVMPSAGPPRLMSTPNPPIDSRETFQVKATLSPEGTLAGHIEWTVTGDSDLTLRSVFHQVNPTQWEQAMQQISYSTGFTGKVSAIDVSNPQDTSKPFHVAYDYRREKYADWDHLQIVPPFPVSGLTAADTRPSTPIDLGATVGSIYDATITLPPGYSAEIPSPVRESSDAVDYECSYSVSGSVVTVHRAMKTKKDTVPVDAWSEYHRLQTTVNSSVGQFVKLAHIGKSTQAAGPHAVFTTPGPNCVSPVCIRSRDSEQLEAASEP